MLTFYYHPLASFCQKALIALYELDVPHEKKLVDLCNDDERAAFFNVWPLGKFPVIQDNDVTIGESSIVIEHVDAAFGRLIPKSRALECRYRDRFFDSYVQLPMQKIVGDHLRPVDKRDPYGVEEAKAQLRTSYKIADEDLRRDRRTWALAGDDFTMADCSAAPALFFSKRVVPFEGVDNLSKYFDRLMARPSVARVYREAEPYMKMFPIK